MNLCECGCGQETSYNRNKKGYNRFVNRHQNRVRINRIEKKCELCEEVFTTIPAKFNKHRFCSNKCRHKHQSNIMIAEDGVIQKTSSGYKMIKMSKHPLADKKGYVHYHRYILEQHLGYVLDKSYAVHHIDEDKTNNEIINLVAIKHKAHSYLHSIMRVRSREGRFM